VQGVLFEETLLGIARLIGPHESVNKPNLSIQRLPALCNAGIQAEILRLVGEAKAAGSFANDWRNRHIAHRDLELAMGTSARALEPATREKVEASLSALRDVMNEIEQVYCNAVTAYYSVTPWDAESLLFVLRDGLLREKDRRTRWNKGERHDDDINPLDPI